MFKFILIINLFIFSFSLYAQDELKDTDWVLKIDKQSITKRNFEQSLYFNLYTENLYDKDITNIMSLPNTKYTYANFLIEQTLLLNDAQKNKYFQSSKEKVFLQSAEISARLAFYSKSIAQEYKNSMVLTDQMVQKIFNDNIDMFRYYGVNEINDSNREAIYKQIETMEISRMLEERVQRLRNTNRDIKADAYVLENINAHKDSMVIIQVGKEKLTMGQFKESLAYVISLQNPLESIENVSENYTLVASYFDSVINQLVLLDEANKSSFFDNNKKTSNDYIAFYLGLTKYRKYGNHLLATFYHKTDNVSEMDIELYFRNNIQAFNNMGFTELNDILRERIIINIKAELAKQELYFYTKNLHDEAMLEQNVAYFLY